MIQKIRKVSFNGLIHVKSVGSEYFCQIAASQYVYTEFSLPWIPKTVVCNKVPFCPQQCFPCIFFQKSSFLYGKYRFFLRFLIQPRQFMLNLHSLRGHNSQKLGKKKIIFPWATWRLIPFTYQLKQFATPTSLMLH